MRSIVLHFSGPFPVWLNGLSWSSALLLQPAVRERVRNLREPHRRPRERRREKDRWQTGLGAPQGSSSQTFEKCCFLKSCINVIIGARKREVVVSLYIVLIKFQLAYLSMGFNSFKLFSLFVFKL